MIFSGRLEAVLQPHPQGFRAVSVLFDNNALSLSLPGMGRFRYKTTIVDVLILRSCSQCVLGYSLVLGY